VTPDEITDVGMSDRARLLQLFDAVWATAGTDATLWQLDEPDAPDALAAFAESRGAGMRAGPVTTSTSHDVVLELDTVGPKRGRITVYVLMEHVRDRLLRRGKDQP